MPIVERKSIPIRKIRVGETTGHPSTFNIRKVDDLLAGNDMIQELHRHDFFFVLALEKGKGDHVIDFTPYKIKNHSIFFLRPGQVHQLTLKKGTTGYLVEFSPDFYASLNASNQLLRNVSSKNHYQLKSENFKRFVPTLINIFYEHTRKHEKYREAINASLEIFFIELLRHRQHDHAANNNGTRQQQRVEDFLLLAETHMATHKDVSSYVSILNVSSYQLNAATKTVLGKTASELINEQIILESKRQLLATSNQIKEIAYQLGYEDVSYFIRFFKKQTGCSPEVFRQKFK